ncbi:MAG: hypothetical protein JWO37_486 [Acidimicrobiales bacterium]|nr:hypothetical protein [Acidimicrobiales bacterium]
MQLHGRDGSELALRPLRYRWPDVRDDPWDANALIVDVRVVSGHGAWHVEDPCLTVFEAIRLARWLAAVAVGDSRASAAGLVEPNIELSVGSLTAHRVRLRATVELESRPPWLASSGPGAADLTVDLDVERAALVDAARDLADELRPFPLRANDPTR